MTLPTFRADDDPGPSFLGVLRRTGGAPRWAEACPGRPRLHDVAHGTTVVAIRYADGVVMAGDRRATCGQPDRPPQHGEGVPADRHSGVAIAGAAGPAVEMVKLFQLQLEHYEKVEGAELSLEGKANQLGRMVRSHLPAAMQGFVVVPLFAGYRRAPGHGPPVRVRRHRRPLRGERLRRHRLGQPARRHGHQDGLPPRPRPHRRRRAGHQLAVPGRRRGLGHRRPRPRAGHLPGGRHHHRRGLHAARRRRGGRALPGAARPHVAAGSTTATAPSPTIRGRSTADEHALLRPGRADDEGQGRLRRARTSPGARPWSPCSTPTASSSAPRTPRPPCARSARSTTASPSRAPASTTSTTGCASPGCATPT